MKKGFTLLEFVVSFAIVVILLALSRTSIESLTEKRNLKEAKKIIVTTLNSYLINSKNTGEEFEITFDYLNEEVIVRDSNSSVIEKQNLPNKLNYTTVVSNTLQDSQVATINSSGQINSFSIYIFDYEELAKYRISIDGINSSGLTHINVYKNINSLGATLSGISSYSYSSNSNKWEEE